MPTPFIDLCNSTLRRLNEVEIPQAGFDNVRGVQALVKDAVRNSVRKINQSSFKWPFNAAEHTQNLTVGQNEYAWPIDLKVVDYRSFQLQEDDSLGISFKSLTLIDRDVWYRDLRNQDNAAGAAGRGVPRNVFPSHGYGFGVSPSPDKAYEIKFRFYLNVVELNTATDSPRIPDDFDHVIVDGAVYFMYMFKDNVESAQIQAQAFREGIKDLENLFLNKRDRIFDTRVAFGGGRSPRNVLPLGGN